MPTTSAVRPLQACPDAFVFPRITVTLPRWWEEGTRRNAMTPVSTVSRPARAFPAGAGLTAFSFIFSSIRHTQRTVVTTNSSSQIRKGSTP